MLICGCLNVFPDTRTSTKTVTVGETFDINPVSLSGISTGKGVLSGSATFPTTDGLAVSPANHSVTIVAAKPQTGNTIGAHNGITGSYTTYSVTALKTGTYVITGSASSCTSYTSKMQSVYWTDYSITARASGSFTCTVTVVDVTSVSIPGVLQINLEDTYTFSPTIIDNRAKTSFTWQSSNTSVATINSSGKLSAKGIGTTTISCIAHNGVSAQCTVTVKPILATSASLNITSAELTTGEKMQLTATVAPTNTTNPAVTWSSTNNSVATVNSSGLVTAVGSGNCSIIATTVDGSSKTASCTIKVPSDVLYTDDAMGVPSGRVVLPIQLKNASAITGLQFELQLPEGVTVAEDGAGKLVATLSDRAIDQSISGSRLSNGNYQFVVFSGTSSALTGSEGAIGYVTLNVAESMATGEYSIGVKEVELTKTDGTSLHHKDLTSKLTLTEAVLGDINGDGRVTVTDAVGIVNHVLHRTPSVFITKAADVNGDGSISVSDAVKVVNIVLNK